MAVFIYSNYLLVKLSLIFQQVSKGANNITTHGIVQFIFYYSILIITNSVLLFC